MSNRTLVEINHDFAADLSDGFAEALKRYLRSASRESADALLPYGVRVIGMRHHSGNFILDDEPDGFPVTYLPRAKSSPQVASVLTAERSEGTPATDEHPTNLPSKSNGEGE